MDIKTLDVLLPSGNTVTIREQTGADEDILSRQGDALSGDAIYKFLSAIITSPDIKPSDILEWKIRDKYYLLLKSRIFSLGHELLFDYDFSDGKNTVTKLLDVDLSEYDCDLSKEPLDKDHVNYFTEAITRYPTESMDIEFELSSGKNIRYEYLTGVGEKKILDKDRDSLSINSPLISRNLKLQHEDQWIPIMVFNMFSSKDMREIRKHIAEHDKEFGLITRIQNPLTKQVEEISLIGLPDFFFPQV